MLFQLFQGIPQDHPVDGWKYKADTPQQLFRVLPLYDMWRLWMEVTVDYFEVWLRIFLQEKRKTTNNLPRWRVSGRVSNPGPLEYEQVLIIDYNVQISAQDTDEFPTSRSGHLFAYLTTLL